MNSADQETIFSLRKKLNALERDKLEAVAASNLEVGQLTADIVRLVAQLEKGEVLKQNIEYDLAKTKKDLAAERQSAANREGSMKDAIAELQRELEEMTNRTERLARDLASSREKNDREVVRLGCIVQDKENVILEQADRITTLEEARSEFHSNQLQKQRLVETLESEIERLQGSNRQLTEDIRNQRQEIELLRERTSKSNHDLSDAYVQIQGLEEAVEAERATHIQTKFSAELIQLRIRDLESAVETEKSAKAEALANVERLSESIRQLQASLEDQRKHTSSAKTKLARSEKELDVYNRQLSSELADKKLLIQSLSGQLQKQQSELDQLKHELNKAKKKQVLLDEAYVSAVSELRLVLSSATTELGMKKPSHTRSGDMVSSKVLSNVVQSVRELVQSYWKTNSVLETNVSTQKRQTDKLILELKDCKEKLSAKYKILKEAESSLTQANEIARNSTDECKRLEKANCDLSSELQRLKQGLVDQQIQSQRLRDQMMRLSVKCKTDEQTCGTFLTLLHQQLNSAVLCGGGDARYSSALQTSDSAARLASEQCDWNDIALLVNEQVSLLVAQHNRAQEKVYELERLLSKRDHVISKFDIAHNGKKEQLSGTQNQMWIGEKFIRENHHMDILADTNSKKRLFEQELASAHHKTGSPNTVNQGYGSAYPKDQLPVLTTGSRQWQQDKELCSSDSLQNETSSFHAVHQDRGAAYSQKRSSVHSNDGLDHEQQHRKDVQAVHRQSFSSSAARRHSGTPVSQSQSSAFSSNNGQEEINPVHQNSHHFNGAAQDTSSANSIPQYQSTVTSSNYSRHDDQEPSNIKSHSGKSGNAKLQSQSPVAAFVGKPQQLEAAAVYLKTHPMNTVRTESINASRDNYVPMTDSSSRPDSDCLMVATALLYGCLTALSARASELAFQRNMLLVKLDMFEKFKQQVADLVSAMTFSDQETPDVDPATPRHAGGSRLTLTLRFRVAVIAVMASNRLSRGSFNKQLSFTSRGRLADEPASLPVFIGLVKSKQGDKDRRSADGPKTTQLTWLHSPELLSAVVDSVADLRPLLRTGKPGDSVEHVSNVAQTCFDSLISHLSSQLPSTVHVNRMQLIDQLNEGLSRVIHEKTTDNGVMHPYVCSQAILDGLQRCVLDFTNRLHCAELGRHELHTRLSQLLQHTDGDVGHHLVSKTNTTTGKRDNSTDKYNSLLTQLTQALEREQTMQDIINEQADKLKQLNLQLHGSHSAVAQTSSPSATAKVNSDTGLTELNAREQQLQQLLKQVESLQREKEALQENVRDAEMALRTASRDKQALASYLASVEAALGCTDVLIWPTDRHLPVQLGISTVGGSRPSSNLSAVRSLVASFVEAHNGFMRRITEVRAEINNLKGITETVTPRLDNQIDETEKYQDLFSQLSKSLEREQVMQETIQEHTDKLLQLDLQLQQGHAVAVESESLSSARSVASLSDRAKPDYVVASAICSIVQPQVTSLSLVTPKKPEFDTESLTSTKSSKSSKSRDWRAAAGGHGKVSMQNL